MLKQVLLLINLKELEIHMEEMLMESISIGKDSVKDIV